VDETLGAVRREKAEAVVLVKGSVFPSHLICLEYRKSLKVLTPHRRQRRAFEGSSLERIGR
jgi:predicted transcriptional regulator